MTRRHSYRTGGSRISHPARHGPQPQAVILSRRVRPLDDRAEPIDGSFLAHAGVSAASTTEIESLLIVHTIGAAAFATARLAQVREPLRRSCAGPQQFSDQPDLAPCWHHVADAALRSKLNTHPQVSRPTGAAPQRPAQ